MLGCDPNDATPAWRSRIGIVLQDMQVFPTLTVAETVRIFADLYPDPRGVAATIDELKSTGVTTVLTTHYMDEAQILADRLVILDDGVVADGTFDELLRDHGDATTISGTCSCCSGGRTNAESRSRTSPPSAVPWRTCSCLSAPKALAQQSYPGQGRSDEYGNHLRQLGPLPVARQHSIRFGHRIGHHHAGGLLPRLIRAVRVGRHGRRLDS